MLNVARGFGAAVQDWDFRAGLLRLLQKAASSVSCSLNEDEVVNELILPQGRPGIPGRVEPIWEQ